MIESLLPVPELKPVTNKITLAEDEQSTTQGAV